MPVKSFHLHLVSDATGETLATVARACLVQFQDIGPQERIWNLIRTPGQITRVLRGIADDPGIVLFTLVDHELQELLQEGCRKLGVPCISVLDPVISALGSYLEQESLGQPGSQHSLNADYFHRIDAIEYTLIHDDGQGVQSLDQADIVLVGVSRTSKTPTCLYLANRGLKVANVPFVPDVPLPEALFSLKGPLVVGLTKDPLQLQQVRRNRLAIIGGPEDQDTDYVDLDSVRREVMEARRLCTRQGWPIIDISRRSIEETAATVLQLYQAHRHKEGIDLDLVPTGEL